MSTGHAACFLCSGSLLPASSPDYDVCPECGHESLRAGGAQTYMTNDDLEGGTTVLKKTGLDKFQSEVLKKSSLQRRLLIDVGSGSGRFLLLNRHLFEKVVGVEVTPACIEHARKQNLDVYESVPRHVGTASVISMWHSLEHVPLSVIHSMLDEIRAICDANTRLIVSVPCSDGLQYRWFRERFAFYDVPNHISQFSRASLTSLMGRHGFVEEKDFYSGPYINFGYVQGFLNYVNPIHNYFYYRLKRGHRFGLSRGKILVLDGWNLFASALVLPVSLLLALVERVSKRRRSIVTLIFRPEPK